MNQHGRTGTAADAWPFGRPVQMVRFALAQPATGHAAKVLIFLALASDEKGESWYGPDEMGKQCSLHVRRVKEALARLVEEGWIVREKRKGHKAFVSRLTVPKGADSRTGKSADSRTGGVRIPAPLDSPKGADSRTGKSADSRTRLTIDQKSKASTKDRPLARARAVAHRREADANGIDFEEFRAAYPKRAGSQRWPDAVKSANARIREGYSWQQMLDGAARYRRYVDATGKTGTEYVRQAATFLGKSLGFMEPWEIPSKHETAWEQGERLEREGQLDIRGPFDDLQTH